MSKTWEQAKDKVQINGCVVRLAPDGVYLHENSSHIAVGIEEIYVDNTRGTLVIRRESSNPVVSVSTDVDESLARIGVTVGLSGGGKTSHIYFYKDGKQKWLSKASDYAEICGEYHNVWFLIVSYDA